MTDPISFITGPPLRTPFVINGPVNFTFVVERFYMDVRDGFRVNARGRPYAKNGYLRFQQTYNWLVKYAALYGETDVCKIDDAWLKNLLVYLYQQPIALNSVSGLIDNIHAISNALIQESAPLQKLTVRVWPEETDAVFNSRKELKKLQKITFDHDTLNLGRDIFLIQSHTGLRVGTLRRFLANPKHFIFTKDKKWYLEIRTNKTRAKVVVPLKKIVVKILKRHKFTFNHVYYEGYYNSLIKVMGRQAGLTKTVTITRTVNGKLKEFVKEKWEVMSSHTARRNFATNAFLARIPIEQIMLITGHRTREEFLKYVKADSFANAMSVGRLKFFK